MQIHWQAPSYSPSAYQQPSFGVQQPNEGEAGWPDIQVGQYTLLQVNPAGLKEEVVLQYTLLQSHPPCSKMIGRASWWWVPFWVIACVQNYPKQGLPILFSSNYWQQQWFKNNGCYQKINKIRKILRWILHFRLVILGVSLRHQLSKTTTTLTTLVEDLLPSTHLSQSRQRIKVWIDSMHFQWKSSTVGQVPPTWLHAVRSVDF